MQTLQILISFTRVRSYSGRSGFPIIIPIPGSTTQERVIENAKEVTLDDSELRELENIMKKTEVAGARYPEH